jgi:hypothetical protein
MIKSNIVSICGESLGFLDNLHGLGIDVVKDG